MRLPFPDHVPLVPVFYTAALLCFIQQVEGTNSTFTLLSFCYIMLSATAFNVAGGFSRTTGAYVFFNSVLGVILGLFVKAYLAEPADSNLAAPILTMAVYVAGMCMIMIAAFLSKKVVPKRALLGKMLTDAKMQTATVGCMITGLVLLLASLFIGGGSGSVLSALNQLNRFWPMAIIFGVLNTVRRSGGRRGVNLPVLLTASSMFIVGLLNFSKESMFAPLAAWLLAASSQRLSISRYQLAGLALGFFIMFHYLVPYSQYGRTFKNEDGSVSFQTSLSLLSDLGNVRQEYLESSAERYEDRAIGYFNEPQGFFDRLQMISIDDAIINHTKLFGTYGSVPIIESFENLVPHFIWPGKPTLLAGNVYAHEIGLLGEEDDTTGVSFSATATAYHLLGWQGVFLLAPVLWFLLFTVFDSLCGDVRKAPWGLLVLVLYTHAGPEGDLNAVIYMTFYAAFGILFAAVTGAYLMPILGTFLIGPEGIELKRRRPISSVPAKFIPSFLPAADPERS